jgi:OmcA/MtrC family decaheme c-type cytochrome
MNPHEFVLQGCRLVLAALIAIVLVGCSGDDGAPGPAGPPGPPGIGVVPTATTLDITIGDVTIQSPPVVQFTVTNEDGIGFPGLTTGDLRFTIAKLMPGVYGSPSSWQSYIVTSETATTGPGAGTTVLQATRENNGTLVDHQDGSYTYTFATDIANVTCPIAPVDGGCVDTQGNVLDLSYQPSLTHRLAIQTRGSLPMVNGIKTFRPDGNPIATSKEIVSIAKCNECHNKLDAHDARIETEYCVMCHNPGSTDAQSTNTVDFKVMIHKIHRSAGLPSVVNGGTYSIYGYNPATFQGDREYDFSNIVFPQDIRNCTKCHSGDPADPNSTPQGDAWQTPSIAACGSCHDDVDFSNHNTIPVTDDMCLSCHKPGFAPTVSEAHEIPAQLARANFQFNIIDVTGGTTPSIQFSVTDPVTSSPYDLTTDEFTGSGARLALDIGWGITDFNNTGGVTNTGFPNNQDTAAMPISIDPVAACGAGIADWSCTQAAGVYTLTKLSALPASATGTGRVGFEGHVAADFNGDTVFDDQVPVKSVVKDFVLTGTLMPRRQVVDIAKCDNCHEFLSLHGGNRNNEPALCGICHNPNATDIGRRPADPLSTTDGKVEEAIDFKTLIHGIHAAAQTNYDGSEAHGFREKGLVIWGYPGAPCDWFGGPAGNSCEHDFSHVRFPGILQDCETCHISGTYELEGVWEYPTTNGILSTTITTNEITNIPVDDDLNISPTAAVCSACHDSLLARSHMMVPGSALFGETQDDISIAAGITPETCALCHGPGRSSDVEVVHAAR